MKAPTRPSAQPRILLCGVLALGGLTGLALSSTAHAAPKTRTRTEKKPPTTAPAEDSKPKSGNLYCRGGGMMRATMLTTQADKLWMELFFRRNPRGLGVRVEVHRLEKGTCAWVDRGVSPDEPNTLAMPTTDSATTLTVYRTMAACALDEHCAFVLGAEVDDDVIRVKKANRVTFHHVP